MEKSILNEISRMMILSKYDNRMTLEENLKKIEIGERVRPNAGSIDTDALIRAFGKSDLTDVKKILNLDINVDDLLLKSDADFDKLLKKKIESEYVNSKWNGDISNLSKPIKDLSKVDVMREVARLQKKYDGLTPPQQVTTDEINAIINKVKSENKLWADELKKTKTPITKKPKPDPNDIQDGDTFIQFCKKNPSNPKCAGIPQRKPTWESIKKWGLRAGITAGVLYAIYWLLWDESPPPIPEPKKTDPVKSQYINCTGEYKLYCKSDVIKEVQQCLINQGVNLGRFGVDGRLGPITDEALKNNFEKYKQQGFFTDDDVVVICKQGGGVVIPPIEPELSQGEVVISPDEYNKI